MSTNHPSNLAHELSSVGDVTDKEFKEIVEEFLDQNSAEQSPSIEVFASRYPAHADRIRRLLPTIRRLNNGDSQEEVSGIRQRYSTETIGDCRIVRKIGSGGMGSVYEGVHNFRNRVAIKLLSPHRDSSADVDRFKREVFSVSRLHHENIVPIYDFGEENSIHYFSMKLIQGPTLAEIINKQENSADRWRKELSHNALLVAKLGIQAASALHHAHENGIVHRDVKPANMMLDQNNKLWITDFGLVKIDGVDSEVSQAGNAVGSLQFMAPEQLQSVTDRRSDTFSLGASLYTLLLASFDCRTEVSPVISQLPLKSPSKIHQAIPNQLSQIILKACDGEPDKRQQSAEELKKDLEAFVDSVENPIKTNQPKKNSTLRTIGTGLLFALLSFGLGAWFLGGESHSLILPTIGTSIRLNENSDELDLFGFEKRFNSNVSFSISGGEDKSSFIIDEKNGFIRFAKTPNFESPHDVDRDNQYNINVVATQGELQKEMPISIEINDVNEVPQTGAREKLNVMAGSKFITVVQVADEDDFIEDGLTFELVQQMDFRHILVSPSNGSVVFRSPPSTELPLDANQDNIYEVRVAIHDQSQVQFGSFLNDASEHPLRYLEDTLDPQKRLTERNQLFTDFIPFQIHGSASADGKTFYVLADDLDNNLALYRVRLLSDGVFRPELLNHNTGLSVNTTGIATADGTKFFVTENVGKAMATLHEFSLNKENQFSRMRTITKSGLSLNTCSLSTLDGNLFFHCVKMNNSIDIHFGVQSSDGSIRNQKIDSSKKREKMIGQAAWISKSEDSNTVYKDLFINVIKAPAQ